MKKILIIIMLILLSTSSVYAASDVENGNSFGAQVKSFFNSIFEEDDTTNVRDVEGETTNVRDVEREQVRDLNEEGEESEVSIMIVRINNLFRINLKANATTGHHWEVDFDKTALKLFDTDYVTESVNQNDPNKLIAGRGGKRIYTFKAIKIGETELVFSYISPRGEIVNEKIYVIGVVPENVEPSTREDTEESETEILNKEFKICSIDSDCILVETIKGLDYIPTTDEGCGCQCVTSISKKFKNLWEQRRSELKNVECKILCPPCVSSMTRPKCENHQCVMGLIQSEYDENIKSEGIVEETGFFNSIQNKVKDFIKTTVPNKREGPKDFNPADESNVPDSVRNFMAQKREEVYNKIRENNQKMNTIREEVQNKIQVKKQEMTQKLIKIKDERKRQAAENIYSKMFNIRGRSSEKYDLTLDKIETVLTNIFTRADKVQQTEGLDVGEVRVMISDSKEKIEGAREKIRNIYQEEFNITISNETELREKFEEARDQLYMNLSDIRDVVKESYEITRSAATALNQIIESE